MSAIRTRALARGAFIIYNRSRSSSGLGWRDNLFWPLFFFVSASRTYFISPAAPVAIAPKKYSQKCGAFCFILPFFDTFAKKHLTSTTNANAYVLCTTYVSQIIYFKELASQINVHFKEYYNFYKILTKFSGIL